ncbi:ABC transporter permease [Pseudomonas sp. RIT-PI-AD]|uniref:ABC transporter permease n=1 Tax=Pseudomonas sp. RIT-PI-AD TaxID=3035294 RepID=UPI0021DACB4A|nr:ABC transporter permease [Pseudomonas sp. RIT-PI-AD]
MLYAVKRILLGIPTLLVMFTLIFLLVRVVPGDAATVILGDQANAASLAALRIQLGLDQPLWQQYLSALWAAMRGDLGVSMVTNRPVMEEILRVLPHTLNLAAASMLLGLLLGLPMGIFAALYRNRWPDYVGRLFSLIGLSLPAFVAGILLLLVFAIQLQWFPVIPMEGGFFETLRALVLPAITLGFVMSSYVARVTRASMLTVLDEDYIRTARAKGIAPFRFIMRHALANALLPIITITGLYFGTLIGNAVLTEVVFNRSGMGRLILGALNTRDYSLLQGLMIVFAAFIVMANVITDLLYGLADPRVRVGR